MKRRTAVKSMLLAPLASILPTFLWSFPKKNGLSVDQKRGAFSIDGNKIRFTHPDITQPFKVTMIADTHLFRDDERGVAFTGYSKRMSKAYNQTKHFFTGKEMNPEIGFDETLQIAVEQQSSLLALVGDIFSFPSEAAIDWVVEKLNKINIPFVYTAGNHDWHYEGMEGTSAYLRDTWINKRLAPLYQGRNPLMQTIEINGINIVVIDNSTYEINEDQLQYLQQSLSTKKPTVLMLHIPLYAPGRNVSFGCGHPEWGAATDKGYALEKRLPWRAAGHTKTTMKFYDTVYKSNNLLGVLAGHIHNQSVDVVNGIPQIVTESNAEGGFLQVSFMPE
jgi:predicted MPP superfamily phosphohydrolase